jgi:leucine dehydrogenase
MTPPHHHGAEHEAVYRLDDGPSQLVVMIAVHSTRRGIAAGGTRRWRYASDELALTDALRLSRAMSYKFAMADMPHGGAKAVMIAPTQAVASDSEIAAYGAFLRRFADTFITAEDVGFSLADCERLRAIAPNVVGTSKGHGDPTLHTAEGVFVGIASALRARWGSDRVEGRVFAVQGLGGVGMALCRLLAEAGGRLIVADIDPARADAAATAFKARVAEPERIHAAECDVFAPCALGGILTVDSIRDLKAGAVAGAANNPLAEDRLAERLHRLGVAYAPDFVINAGGVIGAAEELAMAADQPPPITPLDQRLAAIGERLDRLFAQSAETNRDTHSIAVEQASAKLR